MVNPLVIAAVFVNPKLVGAERPGGEIRNDDGDMPGPGHHRVRLVGHALKRGPRVRVNVGNDRKLLLSAHRPQLCKSIALQNANAGRISIRVNIVVKNGFGYFTPFAMLETKKEYARLVLPPTTAFKFADDPLPSPRGAVDAVLRGNKCPYSRFD